MREMRRRLSFDSGSLSVSESEERSLRPPQRKRKISKARVIITSRTEVPSIELHGDEGKRQRPRTSRTTHQLRQWRVNGRENGTSCLPAKGEGEQGKADDPADVLFGGMERF